MEKKKVVIISGKQFSGKDTVASVLNDVLEDFKLAPLADAIKIEFGEEKNLTFNEIDRNKPLYRTELIELGTRRRQKDKNYWINKVLSMEGNLIISDVRLQHELETFKKFDAIAIRVEAKREERAKRGRIVEENDYTEIDLDSEDGWDYVIENNGTIEELKEQALKVAEEIIKEFSRQLV